MASTKQRQVGKKGTCEVRGCTNAIFLKPNRLDEDGRYKCSGHLKSPVVEGPIPKAKTLEAWAADPKNHPSAADMRKAETAAKKAKGVVKPKAKRAAKSA